MLDIGIKKSNGIKFSYFSFLEKSLFFAFISDKIGIVFSLVNVVE